MMIYWSWVYSWKWEPRQQFQSAHKVELFWTSKLRFCRVCVSPQRRVWWLLALIAMSAISFYSGMQSNTDQHYVVSFLRTGPCSSRIAHLQLCGALLVKNMHKPESPSFFQMQLVSCWQEGVQYICLYRVSDLLGGKIVAVFPLDARCFPACAVITFWLWTKEWFGEVLCWLT